MSKNETPFAPGDRVLAYLRDSGHEKQELSINQQERAVRDFCIESGLVLAEIYKDEARQGSNDTRREKLQEMMNELRHGLEVAGVVVWSNSRFARNSIHAQFYRSEIRKLGYKFHSLTDKVLDGPEAIIFEALIDYKNEQFLVDLSIDVKRGLRDLVKNHGCVPGAAPTGFRREPVLIGTHRDGKPRTAHRWIFDEAVIERVKQAFEMRAAGSSLGEINTATRLFSSVNSYRTFFCNKIYIGILEFGDDLVVEDYCAPIVDQGTWQRVQTLQNHFRRRKHMTGDSPLHPRRVSSQYLLTGLANCGRCGSPLFGRAHIQKSGKTTTSYYCSQAYNQRNCTKQRIPGQFVEEQIIQVVAEKLQSKEYLISAAKELQELISEQSSITKLQRNEKSKELGEARRQITNISNAIADGGHSRSMLDKLQNLEKLELELINDLAQLNTQRQPSEIPILTVDDLANKAEEFKMLMANNTIEISRQRQMLRNFVQRVDIDRDGRRLFGIISVFFPPNSDDIPHEVFPPSKPTRGEAFGKTVRMSASTSGPPLQKTPALQAFFCLIKLITNLRFYLTIYCLARVQ